MDTIKQPRTKWNNDSFRKRIKEIAPDIEIVGQYTNSSSKIECHCKICGTKWMPTANNLLQNRSHCPNCSKQSANTMQRMSESEFLKRVSIINDSVEIIGKYTGTKEHITCRCKKCGNIWSPTGDSLLRGSGCRKCSYISRGKKKKYTNSKFVNELSKKNPNIIVLGKYTGTYDKIPCKCKICNYEWEATPHYLLTGRGCANCAHTSTSYIEQFILQSFISALGKECVVSRDRETIGQELDIYIPKLKIAIEPGSWKWHSKKAKKDIEKLDLCKEKGIELLIIYYDYDGPTITNTNMLTFKSDISLQSEQTTLINLVKLIFKKVSVTTLFSSAEWQQISNLAYINSRRITTEQFKERLKTINDKIEVLGEYKSYSSKLACKCTVCGYEWNATAGDLLSGRGCKMCGIRARREKRMYSQEEYEEKVKIINPNIEIKGVYKGNKNRIDCICKKCGHIWAPIAGELINSKPTGCPVCAGTKKLTTGEFIELMKNVNPDIEIVGKYVNTETKIDCICKTCGHRWSATPHMLKDGHGCPKCAGKKRWAKRRMNQN